MDIYFTKPFRDVDSNYIPGGGGAKRSPFYKRLTCAVNKFTHIITVPQFNIPCTTTGSDTAVRAVFILRDSTFSFVRYLNHSKGAYWVVPDTVTSWQGLMQYNDTH